MTQQERLNLYPSRNDIISSTDQFNETIKIQNNFDDIVNNLVSLGGNNNFTGTNIFEDIQGLMNNIGFGIEAITSTPGSAVTIVSPIKLIDVTAGNITMTLPKLNAGNLGKILILDLNGLSGSYTCVISCGSGDTLNATGNNRITMDAIDDSIVLIGISSTRWLVLVNNSCALSTV